MNLVISKIDEIFSSALSEVVSPINHLPSTIYQSLDSYQEIFSTKNLITAGAVAAAAVVLFGSRGTAFTATRATYAGTSLALAALFLGTSGCAPANDDPPSTIDDPRFTPDDPEDTNENTNDTDTNGTNNTDDTGDSGTQTVADDADGDGFSVEEDCNDDDAAIHPEAAETCADEVDNNCDGTVDEECLSGAYDLDSLAAKISGNTAGVVAGYDVADAGDQNGDGLGDIVVGVPYDSTAGSRAGAAYVFEGPLTGDLDLSDAVGSLTGEVAGDNSGHVVTGIGDASGDGIPDILIAGRYAGDTGSAYLFDGPFYGQNSLGNARLIMEGEGFADFADADLTVAGDQLVIGVAGYENGYGAVYLVDASQTGIMGLGDATAKIVGVGAFDEAGEAVASGDMDGDGVADVVIGAPDNRGVDGSLYRLDPDSGAAEIGAGLIAGFYSPIEGNYTIEDADWIVRGTEAGQNLGNALAMDEDIDGDGNDDLLAGSQYKQRDSEDKVGSAYLWLGPLSGEVGLDEAQATFLGEAEQSNAGDSVALLGDVDGNGQGEYLIGASGYNSVGSFSGTSYLFYGPVSGQVELGTAHAMFTGSVNSLAGSSVSKGGDTDGDGVPELLVGAYGDDSYTGAAFVLPGLL